MRKKGFSLTEVLIALTIVGILSLLGLNYIKRNASNYDKLFYYSAYEALTQGFADAIANNNSLTSTGFCNYLLTIWNVDTSKSTCNSMSASRAATMERFSKTQNIGNSLNFSTMYKNKLEKIYKMIAELFNKTSLPAYAVYNQNENCPSCPCPAPGQNVDPSNSWYAWCGNTTGCQCDNWLGNMSCTPCQPSHGYAVPLSQAPNQVDPNIPPVSSCTPPLVRNSSWGSGCYYPDFCQNCIEGTSFYNQHQSGCIMECNPAPPPNTCDTGMHWDNITGQCIYDGDWDPCEQCLEDNPSLYGFTADACETYLNGTLCNEPTATQSLVEVGHITTKNGITFRFYSELTYSLDDFNMNYFAIKAELPKNPNDAYFLVVPETKELFPITPDMIDDEKLLPTYLTSDYQNYKNTPITDLTTYRSARCTVETIRPPLAILIIPFSHNAYSEFINIAGLDSYPTSYCTGTKVINWIDSNAYTVPRNTVTIKTRRPKGMK